MSKLFTYLSFLGPISLLVLSSLVILHSVAPEAAATQLVYVCLGLGLFFLVSKFDYQLYMFSPWPWYAAASLSLGVTLVLAEAIRGSSRWLHIAGIAVQTSELAKPLLVIFLSSYLSRTVPKTYKSLGTFALIMLLPVLLIDAQPDLGSALIVLIASAAALLAAGANLKKLAPLILIACLVAPLGYARLKPYQKQRLISFVNPAADPLGSGYNALQATIAVGSGKFFGRGLGQGTQSHLRFLPERQTDFIFASLVEELGFVGGALLIGAYFWLGSTLLHTARVAKEDGGSIISLTALTILLAQATINIGMNMGLLPVTGITLPLVSAGGSSTLSFFALLGLVCSINLHSKVRKPTLEIK